MKNNASVGKNVVAPVILSLVSVSACGWLAFVSVSALNPSSSAVSYSVSGVHLWLSIDVNRSIPRRGLSAWACIWYMSVAKVCLLYLKEVALCYTLSWDMPSAGSPFLSFEGGHLRSAVNSVNEITAGQTFSPLRRPCCNTLFASNGVRLPMYIPSLIIIEN